MAKKPRVRIYFGPVEWAKLQDVAAGNNMSESDCFKKAGMAYIDNVIKIAMARMEEETARKQEQEDGQAGTDDSGRSVSEGESSEVQSPQPPE